jgi:hypothetical protein
MDTINHQQQGEEVIVWTYPANGSRYTYRFDDEPLELKEKTHTTNPATTEEQTKTVAPTLTPAVREYLTEQGFEL